MAYNREEAHCCGSVPHPHQGPAWWPPRSARQGWTRRSRWAPRRCSPCVRAANSSSGSPPTRKSPTVEVQDLAHFAAAALGYEFPNPHPEALRQWAVFDAMITLMTPPGLRRPHGHYVAAAYRRHALRHGSDDAPHGQDTGSPEHDETHVPCSFPDGSAHDDAESDADHARPRGRTYPLCPIT